MKTRLGCFLGLVLLAGIFVPVSNGKGAAGPTPPGPGIETRPAPLVPSLAPDAVAYYNGQTQYSAILNCASIIQGTPYYEYGIGSYVGFASDPQASLPGPGDIYYIHIVIVSLGNSCSGQRAYVDIQLPYNTHLAISYSNPVLCYINGAPDPAECPQVLPPSSLNPGAYQILSPDYAHAQTWPLPQGTILEFQVPVTSSTALSDSIMQANVWALDGNSSPWLRPQVGVYVFSNTPTLFYPTPSTDSITATGAASHATLYSHGLSGTVYFDLGITSGSYSLFTVSGPIAAGPTAWLLDSTWPGYTFTPNTIYHWRARFVSDVGPTTYFGVDQTFQTLPDGQMTVGSGSPGSCDEAAFDAALTAPGAKKIIFNCGPSNVSIALTGSKTIVSSLTIDGDNKVTLQGNNTFRLLDVAAPATLTLNKITLSGGGGIRCGGAVHVQGGATLIASYTRLVNNSTSGSGGGLCVEANGSAELSSVYITANHAGLDGGGIYNAGLVDLMWSEVSSNTASGVGSGGGAYNSGSLYFTTSLVADNQTATGGAGLVRGQQAGGGLYNSGNASFFASSVANNLASYGGGIFNNGGTLSITSVTIADNASNAYGKNAEFQSGGLDSSLTGNAYVRNTLIAGNTAAGLPGNCGTSPQKTIVSQGNNLDSGNQCWFNQASDKVNSEPRLGPLANNGGLTRTLALAFGSPAIDAADNAYCGMYDQRGFSGPTGVSTLARQVDGNHDGIAVCDIGAYEYFPQVFMPFARR